MTPRQTPTSCAASCRGAIDDAKRDVILLNAAAALLAAGVAADLEDGIAQARVSIDSGAALAKLDALIAFSARFKDAS